MSSVIYTCALSEKSLQKAKDELHEDPAERLGAVQTLKEWIDREPWITAPTDPLFLLSFLRCAKFSQLGGRERLANFLASLGGSHEFLQGHDPGDPTCLDILRCGALSILPGKDKNGTGIVLVRLGDLDTSGGYSFPEFLKAIMPLLHSFLFFDEEVQVNGFKFLNDVTGASMSMITWAGLTGFKDVAEYFGKAVPARMKGFEYYNIGPVYEAFMPIFKPLLLEKIRNRVRVHHTLLSVYAQIDKSVLPQEYLPDDYNGPTAGKVNDIIEKLRLGVSSEFSARQRVHLKNQALFSSKDKKQNIQDYLLEPVKRMFLKDLYSGKYFTDLSKRPTEPEAMASFRKLNIS